MPVKAYIGLPRAGKSYEVVVNVIIPALRQGRRVVSNLAGLNYDQICQIFYREGISQSSIGQLVSVDHAEVEKPNFWRTDTDEQSGIETFLQPGDVLVLDEVWRFWKKRGDIHPRCMNFFRMHGHMPHPDTGFICEIALISQSIRDFNENIRDVILETYQMVKNTKLGSSKSYIVHVFQRGSTSKNDFIRTLPPRFYDQQYFPCYKSHSQKKDGQADAVEENPDDRGNVLKGALFKFALPLALVFLVVSIVMLWRFFHRSAPTVQASNAQNNPSVSAAANVPPVPPVSQSWRVVGIIRTSQSVSVSLVDASGNLRVIQNPPSLKTSPFSVEVPLPEGGFAVSWASFSTRKGLMP